jgi:hypothetical protein
MFESVESAREFFARRFDAEATQRIVGALRPGIAFEPIDRPDEPALGATRFGGLPDLSAAHEWPIRPVPDDIEAIVACGGSHHGEHIRAHLSRALPFPFVAQIDLAEAARLGGVARDLPDHGRLLFFYDIAPGPWRDGVEACRVIWDQAPLDAVTRRARLPIFDEIDEVARRLHEKSKVDTVERLTTTDWETLRPGMREAGMSDEDIDAQIAAIREVTSGDALGATMEATKFVSSYGTPARAMRLRAAFATPNGMTLEPQLDAELEAVTEILAEQEPLGGWQGDLPSRTRHQLLGTPVPEQDDPRAAPVERGGREWPDVLAEAKNWRLLLQVGMEHYAPDAFAEGTVYFLIHSQDLAKQRFDHVFAVYQQT